MGLPLPGLAGAELQTVGNNAGTLLFLELMLGGSTLMHGQDELHLSVPRTLDEAFLQGLLSAMASKSGSRW
jgi:hypothetical protein